MHKDNLLKIFLLIIGITTPILTLMHSDLAFRTKKIPLSPLPLVFDQPFNRTYWGVGPTLKFQTEENEITVIASKENLQKERRGWARHVFYHSLMGTMAEYKPNPEALKIQKTLLCKIILPFYDKKYETIKVLKVSIEVNDKDGQYKQEYLCD